MSAEFRVRIELGNAEMQRGEEIAEALRKVADELEYLSMDGKIFDVNGNTVGTYWHVKASMAEPSERVRPDGPETAGGGLIGQQPY